MTILNPQPKGLIPGTKNFYWSEFLEGSGDRRIRSVRYGTVSFTAEQVRDNIQNIATWLQRLRDEAVKQYPGVRGITITSGFRPPEVNRSVGGAPLSFHQGGLAADIRIIGLTIPQTVDLVIKIGFPGGIGVNTKSNFVHLDLGRKRAFPYGNPGDAKLVEQINKRR